MDAMELPIATFEIIERCLFFILNKQQARMLFMWKKFSQRW
jgi:hypothetical protein